MHEKILNQNSSILLVIDFQEKFQKIVFQPQKIADNILKMIHAANILNIPVVYTEQYPKGLGQTVEPLKRYLEGAKYFEKTDFSCCGDQAFVEYLRALNRWQIIVCGVETHICVNQTVLELLANGFSPHVIRDAVSSRNPINTQIGINKMRDAGAVISCIEMALFELLIGSKHDKFRDIQKLII